MTLGSGVFKECCLGEIEGAVRPSPLQVNGSLTHGSSLRCSWWGLVMPWFGLLTPLNSDQDKGWREGLITLWREEGGQPEGLLCVCVVGFSVNVRSGRHTQSSDSPLETLLLTWSSVNPKKKRGFTKHWSEGTNESLENKRLLILKWDVWKAMSDLKIKTTQQNGYEKPNLTPNQQFYCAHRLLKRDHKISEGIFLPLLLLSPDKCQNSSFCALLSFGELLPKGSKIKCIR